MSRISTGFDQLYGWGTDRAKSLAPNLLTRAISQVTRWDQLRTLLELNVSKLTRVLYQQVTTIDFVGTPLVDLISSQVDSSNRVTSRRYAPLIDLKYPFPDLLTQAESSNFLALLEPFTALKRYRVILTLDYVTEATVRVLLNDQRARELGLNSLSFLVPDWLALQLGPTLARRTQAHETKFSFICPRFYYSNGVLHLDGPTLRQWNQFSDKEYDYRVDSFLKAHTLVIRQWPRTRSMKHLEMIRQTSTVNMTTLVLLQGPERFNQFGELIEFAGSTSITDPNPTTSTIEPNLQQATSDLTRVNFPNIRYCNMLPSSVTETSDPIYQTVYAEPSEIEPQRFLNQIGLAEALMDDLVKRRTKVILGRRPGTTQEVIKNLPNLHAYEIPILEEDLDLARGIFPNVHQFAVWNTHSELVWITI